MKKILIVVALSGMLIPALASAELNYNAVDVGYSKTSYSNGDPDLTGFDVGISKSISSNVFLEASYGSGSQATNTTLGDITVSAISVGAGYHTPLKDNVDAIVTGDVLQGSVKLAGFSESVNGYAVGAGVRAMLTPEFEGILGVVYTSVSSGTVTSTDTSLNAKVGFNITPEFQLTAGMDFESDQTISFGVRFFY